MADFLVTSCVGLLGYFKERSVYTDLRKRKALERKSKNRLIGERSEFNIVNSKYSKKAVVLERHERKKK
jgi:hypothetical protein